MRRTQGKASKTFYARVDLDTDERRRRLQEITGQSLPGLVEEALRSLEAELERRGIHEPTA
jgi:hypothetical protein